MRAFTAATMAAAAMISPAATISPAKAQQDPLVLPICGQICIQNMVAQGPVLGCPTSDARCLCSNPNFGYGVRDCAVQACHPVDAQLVIVFGLNYCAGAPPVHSPPIASSTVTSKTTEKPTPSSIQTPYTVLEIDSVYADADGAVKISTMISTQGAVVATTEGAKTKGNVVTESNVQPATSVVEEEVQVTSTQDGPDQEGDGNEYSSITHKKEGSDASSTAASETVSSSSSEAGGVAFAAMRTMDALALGVMGVAVGLL
ncbi:hypothetical protein QBC43DRAFT_304004 [Cladorrhinum sp. PSN259]|nr:hypothetical protein QBC43DRAFT_304004 [Cladorrhinum sp. PSN259]